MLKKAHKKPPRNMPNGGEVKEPERPPVFCPACGKREDHIHKDTVPAIAIMDGCLVLGQIVEPPKVTTKLKLK